MCVCVNVRRGEEETGRVKESAAEKEGGAGEQGRRAGQESGTGERDRREWPESGKGECKVSAGTEGQESERERRV